MFDDAAIQACGPREMFSARVEEWLQVTRECSYIERFSSEEVIYLRTAQGFVLNIDVQESDNKLSESDRYRL